MRALAVGAHPDDLDMLCGGTLARYVREGHQVTMCHVALGDRGSFVHTAEEIARIRLAEAKAAAAVIGAEHRTLGISDGEVNAADPVQRDLALDLIRPTRPDVILTHSPNDYMADHNEVSKLLLDASHIATLPLKKTGHPAHDVVPAVYYIDTLAGVGFTPTEYVDISADIDTKLAALGCHASQLDWLRDHDGVDIIEQTRVSSRYRGYQSGVPHAEGFAACLTWLRTRTIRYLP
ncbi:MAG TPA: PIG-L family deacetylase [Streptosporangiaceae bacterium]|jgi:LmbE family N-acetylglucosaminyl deacetylase